VLSSKTEQMGKAW